MKNENAVPITLLLFLYISIEWLQITKVYSLRELNNYRNKYFFYFFFIHGTASTFTYF